LTSSSTYFSLQQQNFLRGSGNHLEQPQKRVSRLTAKNSWMNWDFSVESYQGGSERSLERPRKREKKMACSGIGESETGMSERDRLWIIQ
jgi:hypothetical protein